MVRYTSILHVVSIVWIHQLDSVVGFSHPKSQRPKGLGLNRQQSRHRTRSYYNKATSTTSLGSAISPDPGPSKDGSKDGTLSSLRTTVLEKVGRVDEDRLVFPEIVSGEVPRVFSNLSYEKTPEGGNVKQAIHSSGSMVGSALLVAGTTLGAGVLALPTATAPAGLLPSSAAIIVAWFYMTISGLLIAELSINRIGETGKPGLGLLELYKSSLGGNWARVGSAAYFFLHYTVMVAYIAQGGSNLGGILDAVGLSSVSSIPGADQLLFAGSIGSLLYFGRQSMLQNINNVMVAGVFGSFLAIMGLGIGDIDLNAMVAAENQHPALVANAFPILFLSMVFHSVVPTVVTQLECDSQKIRNSILLGTSIPLVMFLGWNSVILGSALNVPGGLESGVNPIDLISQGAAGEMIGGLVGTFSILAIATSMIGMFYGLLDALTDFFEVPSSGPKYEQWKPLLFAGGFIPPLIFSVGNPDIFYDALDYGGAFGVSTLFLVLPPIMVWKLRYTEEKPLTVPPMVPLGKIPLAGLWKAAGTLILEQGADKLGVFDFIKTQLSSLEV